MGRRHWLCSAVVLLLGALHAGCSTVIEDCPTYFVNLDRSPDRRARMERLFATFSELQRVAGVDGHSRAQVDETLAEDCSLDSLPHSFDDANLGVAKGSGTYLSRLGCSLSHLRAILKAGAYTRPLFSST
jgi:GR25 family glycosyltransferase involved in LPS biosynthesis